MYYILDSLVKNLDPSFCQFLEKDVMMMFLKDFKEALLKENVDAAKGLLILFLTWEDYFASESLNTLVEKLYTEGI
jgi:hypothetical protein